MCSFCGYQNDAEKLGLWPILNVIHTTSIGTMLNFNGSNNGHGLEMLRVNIP